MVKKAYKFRWGQQWRRTNHHGSWKDLTPTTLSSAPQLSKTEIDGFRHGLGSAPPMSRTAIDGFRHTAFRQ
jgi:hypothetical protein